MGPHGRRRSLRRPTGGIRVTRLVLEGTLVGLIGTVVLAVVLARLVPLTGRQALVIAGGSMEPAISIGAAVILEPVTAAAVRSGDVVTIRPPAGAPYTHRVTRVVERDAARWMETQGDANAEPDPVIIPAGWVAGRVVAVVPYAGYLLRWLAIPSGALMIIYLAITLLISIALLESIEDDPRPRSARSATRHARRAF